MELHYRDGKLEFPPDHVGKRKYVTVKGFPYSVPACYCYFGGDARWHYCGEEIPAGVDAPMIMRDIAGYTSPLDGSYVSSRSQHRDHMNRHGVIERGNEPIRGSMPEFRPSGRIGMDIKRAMGKL